MGTDTQDGARPGHYCRRVVTYKSNDPRGVWVALLVGAVFFGAGLWWHLESRPYPDGLTATGTITGYEPVGSKYEPRITFTTADGRELNIGGISSRYTSDVGTKVDLSYRPAAPEYAKVVSSDWWDWILMILGPLVALAGIAQLTAILVLRRRLA